ncbi:hypothetical protein PROFUN_00243 [Planoprotostelium fungivorum]|uniref:Uncharacterized protein n=1 Tax=Planoprotostelium fungivorum TaxID=1890364 RepID=A0A2P6NXU5_9EUKA|nr:hypothetical protein PROFUN_00243 [Planoprotostelium fungivorum]
MRQWIYFSGTWIEITDCYGGPPLHIRWAQLERESWMKIQWPSYDIPARFEMLQQRHYPLWTWMGNYILLVSGRHVTSLCQQSLNIFTFLLSTLGAWSCKGFVPGRDETPLCLDHVSTSRQRQSPRQSQDETVSAGGPPLHIRWAQLERESWMKIQWPSYDIPARFEMLQQRTWMAIMCDEVKRDSLCRSLDLALILGVLKRYCSAEESDNPYTMNLCYHPSQCQDRYCAKTVSKRTLSLQEQYRLSIPSIRAKSLLLFSFL